VQWEKMCQQDKFLFLGCGLGKYGTDHTNIAAWLAPNQPRQYTYRSVAEGEQNTCHAELIGLKAMNP